MSSDALFAACTTCGRGAEACQWCERIGMSEDWETTCDCGLADFDRHLNDCLARTDFRYVIASDYDTATEPRA